jgi:hypothetical protein
MSDGQAALSKESGVKIRARRQIGGKQGGLAIRLRPRHAKRIQKPDGGVDGEDARQRETPMAKIDAIKLLKDDHREVEDLFEQFEKATAKDRKAKIVQKICTELTVHSLIEEEIFYPTFRGKIEDDLLDEGYVEHDGAKMLIAELMAGDPDDAFYDAKVSVLSEEIEHHVKEEERPSEGMFAQCRRTDVDLVELAERMQARKDELMAMIKANGLPAPETRSFKGAKVIYGQPPAAPTA